MTYRSSNRIVELEGINYVRSVVQSHNSIYQEIAGQNDQGNDGYIEFVINGLATNFGVFVQIKSGNSYKDQRGYKIPTDKNHLTYWSNGLYPIVSIVYDKELKKAFWISISDYTKKNPSVLESDHHTIRVSSENEFSAKIFEKFIQHFMSSIQHYKSSENYGRSLNLFGKVADPELCIEGLKSLYSNFRDHPVTWFSFISNFGNIQEEIIHRNILGFISNYADNPDIFWHEGNLKYYPTEEIKDHIKKLVSAYFGEKEFKVAFPYLKHGVNRGNFSFLVFLVIDMVKDAHEILKKISFEENLDPDDRNHWFWLYMHIGQYYSIPDLLTTTDNYLNAFPECANDEVILGMREAIQSGVLLPIG